MSPVDIRCQEVSDGNCRETRWYLHCCMGISMAHDWASIASEIRAEIPKALSGLVLIKKLQKHVRLSYTATSFLNYFSDICLISYIT